MHGMLPEEHLFLHSVPYDLTPSREFSSIDTLGSSPSFSHELIEGQPEISHANLGTLDDQSETIRPNKRRRTVLLDHEWLALELQGEIARDSESGKPLLIVSHHHQPRV